MGEVRKTFPLHLHITLLFVILMLVVGSMLVGYNHARSREIILSASRTLFGSIVQEVLTHFSGTHRPAATLVSLLTRSPLATAGSLAERLEALPLLREALAQQPYLSAIQAGYDNGDYFILRPIADPDLRQRFHSPPGTAYVADHIGRDDQGRRTMTRIHYDAHLGELARETGKETRYDPRIRPWYRLAQAGDGPTLSRPYLYYFLKKIGVTVARRSTTGNVVMAADLTLDALSRSLASHEVSPSAELLLYTGDGEVIAYGNPEKLVVSGEGETFRIARIQELGNPLLRRVAGRLLKAGHGASFKFEHGGAAWIGEVKQLETGAGLALHLAVLAPERELLGEAYRIAGRSSLIAIAIILLALPLIWLFARRISLPLHRLAMETRRIQRLDFGGPASPDSSIREVHLLARAMDAMRGTINRFLHLVGSLAAEQDFNRMLELFTRETREASGVQAAGVLLFDEERAFLEPAGWDTTEEGWCSTLPAVQLEQPQGEPFLTVLRENRSRLLTVKAEEGSWFGALLEKPDGRPLGVALLPLVSRSGEPMGVVLLLSLTTTPETPGDGVAEWHHFVSTLSGFAAVSLETRRLLASRKALLDGFIQVIAGAIDAKSPYTGGHCQRVPVLTRMLDEAAAASDDPPFHDYRPTEADREALHIAAWLHDCGKVTTPEYVVDKATRLETLYDRIHEIRMRFEVLKRDAWIRYWQGIAEGGDEGALKERLESTLTELDEEFAFVAACNDGDLEMTPERVARLHRIGRRTWLRTLDDTLGVSPEEHKRKERNGSRKLPVEEPLLADRPEHLVGWNPKEPAVDNGRWRFRMEVPRYRFNRGELHNLSIEHGTLTEEERYLINQHIVQTILMLDQLPYPRHLRQVPEIAGGHHERMDGTGYPRRLKGREMPLQARMMAIADVFEALTAADRPYKRPKKLSEAVRILWFMKQEGHIDPDLFELFLRSGVYLEYAKTYLPPEQVDEVEIEAYLGTG